MAKTNHTLEHPLAFTSLLGTSGAVVSAYHGEPSALLGGLATGGLIDSARFGLSSLQDRRFRSEPIITQLVGTGYLEAIIDSIRRDYGFSGDYRIEEEDYRLTGKSAFEGGYFHVFRVYFDGSAEPFRVVYKQSHDPGKLKSSDPDSRSITPRIRDGADFSDALHELALGRGIALDCIPRPIRPQDEEWAEYGRRNNLGEFFPWIGGESLERRIDSTSPIAVPDDAVIADVSRVLDEINIVHGLTGGLNGSGNESEPVRRLLAAPHFDTHRRLMHRLTNLYGPGRFAEALEDRLRRHFDGIPRVFLHGDLSHQNIRQDGNSTYLFDLDFGNWGIAHEDFFKLCMKSGVVNHPAYAGLRSRSAARSMKLHPGLQAFHFDLVEYELQLYYLLGALGMLSHARDSSIRDGLMAVSKSLFDGSGKSMAAYSRATGDWELSRLHNEFYGELDEFADLTRMEPVKANLAYLHDAERMYKNGNAGDIAEANKGVFRKAMQACNLSGERIRASWLAVPAIGTALGGAGTYYLHDIAQKYGLPQEMFERGAGVMAAVIALSWLNGLIDYRRIRD